MLTSDSRVMLIAPHPDDESLACSVILQRAVRAGSSIRIVYATDGDNNPWPQRLFERKWRIDASDRKRWGKLRRSEASAALRMLGVHANHTQFLALPDQGLTNLLRTDCKSTLELLAAIIRNCSPTHLLVPSISDTHPDHSALAVMLRLVLAEIFEPGLSTLSYAVHGKSEAFFGRAEPLLQSQSEAEKKLGAILCHKTQIKLSRKRFLGYAHRPEQLLNLGQNGAPFADGPIREVVRQDDVLCVKMKLSPKLLQGGKAVLFLLGKDSDGLVRCLKACLTGRSGKIDIVNVSADLRTTGHYRGDAFAGEFAIPIDLFSPAHALFVKLERRSLFFDEAGWVEVPPAVRVPHTESLVAARPSLVFR
ncbi:MAG: PIG-L family deacetylase [Verrucomicrobiota bacterium]